MTHYGIIGGGTHPENIIEDGLKDIFSDNEDHTLYVYCHTNATESEKRVYNYILDNDIPFNAVTSDKTVPKILLESAEYIISESGTPESVIINNLAANSGTLLVIWDDERELDMGKYVTQASDMGVTVLELSNGLTPFILESSVAEKEPITEMSVQQVDEVEMSPLTREELSEMNIGLLKKAAFAQGIADAGAMSKDALVDTLAGYEQFIVASDISTPRIGTLVGSLVWVEDGVMNSMQLEPELVAQLLRRC